jgi:hypothetical protein
LPPIVKKIFVLGTDVLGFLPAWLSQMIVAATMTVLGVLVANWTVRKALPSLSDYLSRALVGLFHLLGYSMLLADYLLARACRAARLTPPALLYAYGGVVARVVETGGQAVSTGMEVLGHLRRLPRKIIVVLLLVILGLWNQAQCDPADPACRRPVQEWYATTGEWFRTLNKGEPVPSPSGTPAPPAR